MSKTYTTSVRIEIDQPSDVSTMVHAVARVQIRCEKVPVKSGMRTGVNFRGSTKETLHSVVEIEHLRGFRRAHDRGFFRALASSAFSFVALGQFQTLEALLDTPATASSEELARAGLSPLTAMGEIIGQSSNELPPRSGSNEPNGFEIGMLCRYETTLWNAQMTFSR
ncbi:MAG: hypothetical protein K0Q54_2278 [Methylobacterium brachiatum]|nr:hypothetical protein [Methylobacterium brachiatum]